MSVFMKQAVPPVAVMVFSASAPVTWSFSAITTEAPSAAYATAMARPMPLPAPVIIATLSLNFMKGYFNVKISNIDPAT
jgi:hypothetical protein